MFDGDHLKGPQSIVAVIGAGIGGLAAALRLQAAGHRVTVFDTHGWPGGKMRTVPSAAGPVDAGPTVLTMRHVFDDLFDATGARLDDHVTLIKEDLLARHFWPDGSMLDLTSDHATNKDAVERFAGKTVAQEYDRFARDAAELFDLFSAPMMLQPEPRLPDLARAALSRPRHLATLSPFATLRSHLIKRFSDRRLAQLFGRYATYVGGTPLAAPALLSLIWQAEAAGVWRVQGGMHKLADALAERLAALGGTLRLGTAVSAIRTDAGRATGVVLGDGTDFPASKVVFAGDPRALATGRLGESVASVAAQTKTVPRSLSARVWSFAATPQGTCDLAHHNVFFGTSETSEFEDLDGGAMPSDPTIYICAEDRGTGAPTPDGPERFEIILNAAPLTVAAAQPDEEETCRQTTFQTLARFGLTFDPMPPLEALATPTLYETLFPASAGSLYGQTPHGMTAALKRPRARTTIPGLYLAGGGTHPGAGVPMAALSGKHAAEAILKDRVSI
jgi:1-hydroxycarotenoid 3,4-desaturase